MQRELPDGYEIDDDRDRIDVDMVHRFLTEDAYWALGRPRETVERLVRESARVIGIYRGDEQVAFARVVSDGTAMAWLGDVFVVPAHRRHGLGVELVREAVEHPPHRDLVWFLNTRDAHSLYERFGFEMPTGRWSGSGATSSTRAEAVLRDQGPMQGSSCSAAGDGSDGGGVSGCRVSRAST